jgi:hypothetical protein
MPIKPTSEISVEVRLIRERAILVDNGLENADGSEKLIWIPKSEIQNWDALASWVSVNQTVDVILPDWLIENENLM